MYRLKQNETPSYLSR